MFNTECYLLPGGMNIARYCSACKPVNSTTHTLTHTHTVNAESWSDERTCISRDNSCSGVCERVSIWPGTHLPGTCVHACAYVCVCVCLYHVFARLCENEHHSLILASLGSVCNCRAGSEAMDRATWGGNLS